MSLKSRHILSLLTICGVSLSAYATTIPDSTLTRYDLELIIPITQRSTAEETLKEEGEVLLIEDDREMLSELFTWSTSESMINIDSIDADDGDIATVHDSIIKKRMEYLDAHSPLILEYNPEVRKYINLYLGRLRGQTARMAGLSMYYYKIFEEILDMYDIPMELKHMVVVESAFNPRARSRVGASGLWQFMYATGRMYGLNSDSYVDERYDPVKSTHAAAKLLRALYDMFDDWNLALAAYNYGSGNVRKAISRSGGGKNYWYVREYMPRETRNYVANFIAVNYVMNYYRHHGIVPEIPAVVQIEVDTVQVKNLMSFDLLTKKLDMPKEELQFLNPQFKLEAIPYSDKKQYTLRLPVDKALQYASIETELYAEAKQAETALKKALTYKAGHEPGAGGSIIYRVKSGDTLGRLALRYGVSVKNIQRWNNMKNTKLRIGQRLTIYPRK